MTPELVYRVVMGVLVGAAFFLVVSVVLVLGRRMDPVPEEPPVDARGYGWDVKRLVRQLEDDGTAVLSTYGDYAGITGEQVYTLERRVRARAYGYRRSLARIFGCPIRVAWQRDADGLLYATFTKEKS